MDIQHQIITGIERPRQAIGLAPWNGAGFPKEKVTIEVERAAEDGDVHSREACARDRLSSAQCASAIDDEIGMMDDFRVTRANVNRADIALLC